MTNDKAVEIMKAQESKQDATNLQPCKQDDLISRAAAIDAIQKAYADTEGGEDKNAVWNNVGLTNALHIMQDLPSASPDLSGYSDRLWKSAYERGKAEAQAEIVRCKDCMHHRRDASGCYYCVRKEYGYGWGLNDFCSDAERRTDE